ncbi:unnamed protein product [Rhizophagus irregularis]|nr:unnamed protein product [Rhizophagus irregularis]
MSSNFLVELSNDYEKLFETELGYDVIIYAGEGPNVKEIHAHSNILCIRSHYFRSAFSNEWAEKKDGKFILRKPNISPHLFNVILKFIYCGKIELKNLQGPDALNLLIAVDELNIQQLISYIQEYLVENQIEFLRQNPIDILETVCQHGTFTDLWKFRLEDICEKAEILFDSDKFINIKATLLELLLKRDDLNMEEIKIWESLLKWCFAQQNMINDPTKWSKEDITKIKRDGFNAPSFHKNCDNKGATIWVAKIQDSTQLIGGYNPLDWSGNATWKKTANSFLFNFKDGKNISTAKLGYVIDTSYAIYCFNGCGPYMGSLSCQSSNKWSYYYNKNTRYPDDKYPNIGIPSDFTVESYEVFQVIRL